MIIFKDIISKTKRHKKIVLPIAVLCLIFLSYTSYKNIAGTSADIKYITAKPTTGTLTVSVSGNGQVLASNSVSVKSKVSGEITSLNVKKGDSVKNMALIARINDTSAQTKVKNAKDDLETAQLNLTKLMQPAKNSDIKKSENQITKAKNNLSKLEFTYKTDYQNTSKDIIDLKQDLPTEYENAFNTVANIFIDLPSTLADMEDVINGNDFSSNQSNLSYYTNFLGDKSNIISQRDRVKSSYSAARDEYNKALAFYQKTSRSDTDKIEELTKETYNAVTVISQALKEINIFLTLAYDEYTKNNSNAPATLNSHITVINSGISSTNPYLSSAFSNINEIKDLKDSITDGQDKLKNIDDKYKLDKQEYELALKEQQQALTDLKTGPDALDIRDKKIVISQKQNALYDAQQTLADYSVYMPFDGVISNVLVSKGDTASSSATIADVISDKKLAQITLNEIDVVKIKIGQKATLTFDAISDFTITGSVVEIDTVGTVAQGVVSYNIKISFDIDDSRIKPGMSANASIISSSKQNALLVPNSAIKTQWQGAYYVETLESGNTVTKKTVTIGIANDTSTEIVSGLDGKENVITNTIKTSTASSAAQSSSSQRQSGQSAPGAIMRMVR